MAKEYPERRNYFWSMAAALREYAAEAPVLEADLFKYLGKPDQYYVTKVIASNPSQSPVTNKIVLSPSSLTVRAQQTGGQ